jgi:hypothetical protein
VRIAAFGISHKGRQQCGRIPFSPKEDYRKLP